MTSHAFMVQSDRGLMPLAHLPFEHERQLDHYIGSYPQLLAQALGTDEAPLRFALVGMQAPVADAESGRTARWAADALFLDQHGVLTIVEDKLSRNPEMRRPVIGQMIEYAANLVGQITPAEIQRQLAQTHEDADAALTAILDAADDEPDLETYWATVLRNVQAGVVRMVFVGDRLPAELRRSIEFLNRHMQPMEVLGVQVRRTRTSADPDGAEVLITSTIGRSESKRSPAPSGGQNRPVTFEAFVQEFEAIGDHSPGATAARHVLEHLADRPELFELNSYRTPQGGARCHVRRRADGFSLAYITANRRRGCCTLNIPYSSWNWPEAMVEQLAEILGYRPGPKGMDIEKWCADSDDNRNRLVAWLERVAAERQATDDGSA